MLYTPMKKKKTLIQNELECLQRFQPLKKWVKKLNLSIFKLKTFFSKFSLNQHYVNTSYTQIACTHNHNNHF